MKKLLLLFIIISFSIVERKKHIAKRQTFRTTNRTNKKRIKELKQAVGERNCVEGKFGQAKRWYDMGNMHAKL